MRLAASLALAAVLFAAAPATPQASPLSVGVDAGAPLVAVGPALDDDALEEAVRSGLPLRMRFTIELWRDQFFDNLVHQSSWTAVLGYEPIGRRFLAGGVDADSLGRYPTYGRARAALEREYRPTVRPTRRGRYYYIVTLEVQTLSLSDLDELERWLRGELEPAVRGGGSVSRAVGTGVKRLLLRVLDVPARRYQARSERFRVP